jgi:hypothetical protein
VKWTVLRPTKATSGVPLLTIQDDNSVLASGDQTKRDIYDVTFTGVPQGITALRMEVLPDDACRSAGQAVSSMRGRSATSS